jgi:dihydroorotase
MGRLLIRNITCSFNLGTASVPFSIAVDEAGKVEKAGEISAGPGDDVIDASGLYVSPGWIDMHTHVYDGVCDIGLNPDVIGPVQGVTTLVDAGSAGHITFPGFKNYIIRSRDYEIYSFLNYGSIGITRCNVICDYETDDFIQPEETLACIEQNRPYIRGLKMRACKVVLKNRRGVEIVKDAVDLAREAGIPLMVHVGEPGPLLGDILDVLREGDIVTHCFHGKPGGIMDSHDGGLIPEAYAARERGVLFDIGHGAASFDFTIGHKAISLGFKPDLMGTDLHAHSFPNPVGSLAITMTKMISCGLDIGEIMDMVTRKPAEVLELDDVRRELKSGVKACFTLFKITENERTYFDARHNPILTHLQINPVMTIMGSKVYRLQPEQTSASFAGG